MRDEAGAIHGFGSVVRDVTDQKAAESVLARREPPVCSVVATLPDAIIAMNESGIVTSFSAVQESVFGVGYLHLDHHIDIGDGEEDVLATVAFRGALTITG